LECVGRLQFDSFHFLCCVVRGPEGGVSLGVAAFRGQCVVRDQSGLCAAACSWCMARMLVYVYLPVVLCLPRRSGCMHLVCTMRAVCGPCAPALACHLHDIHHTSCLAAQWCSFAEQVFSPVSCLIKAPLVAALCGFARPCAALSDRFATLVVSRYRGFCIQFGA
jgi:hypothetical protein